MNRCLLLFCLISGTAAAQQTQYVHRNGDTMTGPLVMTSPITLGVFASDGAASGSPTNGMEYYNSTTGRVRCYQAATWVNCIPTTSDIGGANSALSNLTTTAVNVDLLPTADNTLNVGSSVKAWAASHQRKCLVHNDATNTQLATLDFSGANAVRLFSDATSTLQLTSGANPGILIGTGGGVTFGSLTTGLGHFGAGGALTSSAVALAGADVSGTLPVARGGTNSGTALSGSGSVVVQNGTAIVQGPAGTATQLLHGNAAGSPTFSAVSLTADVTGVTPVANGGTNSAAALSGSTLMVSNGSAVVQGAAGTTATVLHGNAAGAPSYGAVALASEVSGNLPIANGGTNSNTALTGSGSLVVHDGTKIVQGAAGTATTLLHGNAAGAPTYSAASLTADVTGTLPVGNGGTNSTAALSGSTLMISNGSAVVQGTAGTSTTLLHGNAAGAPTYSAVSLTADVTGTLPINKGGTNSFTSLGGAAGAIMYTDGTSIIAGPVVGSGGVNDVLHSGNGAIPTYSKVALTSDVTGTLPVGNGGTGTATAFTSGSVVFAGGSGVYTQDAAALTYVSSRLCVGCAAAPAGSGMTVTSDSAAAGMRQENWNATPGLTEVLISGRGTRAAPTAIQSGDQLWSRNGYSQYDSTVGHILQTYQLKLAATENYSSTNAGTTLTLGKSRTGANTVTTELTLDGAGLWAFTGGVSSTTASVGSGKLTIDVNGNLTKVNNVTTSFPGSQGLATSILTNDGTGTLTWSKARQTTTYTWGNSGTNTTTTTRWMDPFWASAGAGTVEIRIPITVGGTLANLRFFANTAGTSANTITYTLFVNGIASTLLIPTTATDTTGTDNVHTVAVSAGDTVSMQITKSGTVGSPTNVFLTVSLQG